MNLTRSSETVNCIAYFSAGARPRPNLPVVSAFACSHVSTDLLKRTQSRRSVIGHHLCTRHPSPYSTNSLHRPRRRRLTPDSGMVGILACGPSALVRFGPCRNLFPSPSGSALRRLPDSSSPFLNISRTPIVRWDNREFVACGIRIEDRLRYLSRQDRSGMPHMANRNPVLVVDDDLEMMSIAFLTKQFAEQELMEPPRGLA